MRHLGDKFVMEIMQKNHSIQLQEGNLHSKVFICRNSTTNQTSSDDLLH